MVGRTQAGDAPSVRYDSSSSIAPRKRRASSIALCASSAGAGHASVVGLLALRLELLHGGCKAGIHFATLHECASKLMPGPSMGLRLDPTLAERGPGAVENCVVRGAQRSRRILVHDRFSARQAPPRSQQELARTRAHSDPPTAILSRSTSAMKNDSISRRCASHAGVLMWIENDHVRSAAPSALAAPASVSCTRIFPCHEASSTNTSTSTSEYSIGGSPRAREPNNHTARRPSPRRA